MGRETFSIRLISKPYVCRRDGRRRCLVEYTVGNKAYQRGVAYARFLMEQKLGRKLKRSEEVDHKDENPLNDKLSNLQVLTQAQNTSKSHRLKPRSVKKGAGRLTDVDVVRLRKLKDLDVHLEAKRYRVSGRALTDALKGHTFKHLSGVNDRWKKSRGLIPPDAVIRLRRTTRPNLDIFCKKYGVKMACVLNAMKGITFKELPYARPNFRRKRKRPSLVTNLRSLTSLQVKRLRSTRDLDFNAAAKKYSVRVGIIRNAYYGNTYKELPGAHVRPRKKDCRKLADRHVIEIRSNPDADKGVQCSRYNLSSRALRDVLNSNSYKELPSVEELRHYKQSKKFGNSRKQPAVTRL
jgi:hypothetical protein